MGKWSWKRAATGLVFACATLFSLPADLSAQSDNAQAPLLGADLETKRLETQHELDELKSSISLSNEKRSALVSEIRGIDKDRESLNRQLLETSARARALQSTVRQSEERLAGLRAEEDQLRGSLNERRTLLAEVLAALQRMGRAPPPALLVTPQDALSSVRSAILLGAVIPEVRSETQVLLGELEQLVSVSQGIRSSRESLESDLTQLAGEEERISLLIAEKRKASGDVQTKLAAESRRAAELAARATSLNGLIASLSREIESSREAVEAAKQAEEERKRQEAERIASAREKPQNDSSVFSNAARIAPAIGFSSAKGLLPLPVEGDMSLGFGEKDEDGEISNGLSLQTLTQTTVTSPADGHVVYAGPFRSYGELLILDAGDGYHVLLAGMEEMTVTLGQFVVVGEPVGRMGARRVASAADASFSTTRPILYVEFRKDGNPVDPTPWWTEQNIKRATNGS